MRCFKFLADSGVLFCIFVSDSNCGGFILLWCWIIFVFWSDSTQGYFGNLLIVVYDLWFGVFFLVRIS